MGSRSTAISSTAVTAATAATLVRSRRVRFSNGSQNEMVSFRFRTQRGITIVPKEGHLMTDFALNVRAANIADRIAFHAAEFGVSVETLRSGARVIDAGVTARGGLAAGQAMAHACMGGLGHASFVPLSIGGDSYQGVQVWTD